MPRRSEDAPVRGTGALVRDTNARFPAKIITEDTVYPTSTATKGSGHSARPPFTAACAPPRIAAPASGKRITQAAQARGGPAPRAVRATTPSTITAVPAAAAGERDSPRKSIAPSTANSGVVLEIVPATVGPVRRFDAKLRKVTSAGKIKPTTAKITSAVVFQPSPRKRKGASSRKNAVVVGMLTSAPRAGSR